MDADFFENNSGMEKLYPGGPTCMYRGKRVPCMARFTPKGSIDCSTLLNIVKTIDILVAHDVERAQGVKPMIILDAHGYDYCSTLILLPLNGASALVCLMGRCCGRLRTPPNKMPGAKFLR